MGRGLAFAVVLGLLLVYLPVQVVPAGSESLGGDLTLIVMPFFTQNWSDGEGRAVFLMAYERIYAVVDVNHNGVHDSGEPVISIEEPGKIVVAVIGWAPGVDEYVSVIHDMGSLWLLVKRPVLAWFAMYNYSSGRVVGSYTMPPPGERIIVPPLPGDVYVSPATPSGANITIRGGPGGFYRLAGTDYLVIPSSGESFVIESDKPVAAVLVNHDRSGPASFAVELVPVEERYLVNGSLPLAEENVWAWTADSRPSSYYIVANDGNVAVGRLIAPASIGELLGGPGVGYSVFTYNNSTVSVVPVYNIYNHPALQESQGYILTAIVLEPFSTSESLVRLILAPISGSNSFTLLADTSGDHTIDAILYDTHIPEGHAPAITGGTHARVRLHLYLDRAPGVVPVVFVSRGDMSLAYSRIQFAPIPENVSVTPPIPPIGGPETIRTATANTAFDTVFEPLGEDVRIKVNASTTASCQPDTAIVGTVLSDSLTSIISQASPDCTLQFGLATIASAPVYSVFYQPYLVSGNRITLLPGIAASNITVRDRIIPGVKPVIPPGPHATPGVYTVNTSVEPYVNEEYRSIGFLDYPSDPVQMLERLTGLDIRALQEEVPSNITLPIGLRSGEKLSYGIAVSGIYAGRTIYESGWLEILVKAVDDEIWLVAINTTLSPTARTALAPLKRISDIYTLAHLGPGHYTTYDTDAIAQFISICPILEPGASHQINNTITIGQYTATFTCTYQNSILQSTEIVITADQTNLTIKTLRGSIPQLQPPEQQEQQNTVTTGKTGQQPEAPATTGENREGAETGKGNTGLPILAIAVIILVMLLLGGLLMARKNRR